MTSQKSSERPMVFIDGQNLFIRHYLVNGETNNKSEPVGGVVGFLKAIDRMVDWMAPSQVYVVWESGGPSARRKRIHEGYKKNRSKIKEYKKIQAGTASVKDHLLTDQETKIKQLSLLYSLLKKTPVCQVFVKGTECDDVVAYLASQHYRRSAAKKIIVSSDKDFYQLLEDPSIEIYDPGKKIIINGDNIYEQYGIAPRNFCLARALVGDVSDNLEGVPGVGLKTAVKRFSALADRNRDVTIDDILQECDTQLAKKAKQKVYRSVRESESLIRRNWKLMYLSSGQLSAKEISKIEGALELHEPKMNQVGLIKEVLQAGLAVSFDFERFSSRLRNSIVR